MKKRVNLPFIKSYFILLLIISCLSTFVSSQWELNEDKEYQYYMAMLEIQSINFTQVQHDLWKLENLGKDAAPALPYLIDLLNSYGKFEYTRPYSYKRRDISEWWEPFPANSVGSVIVKIGNSAGELLIKKLNHQDPRVRDAAVFLLGEIEFKDAIPLIIPLLEDPHPYVRANTLNSLGKMNSSGFDKVAKKFLQDKDEWVRASAAYYLGKMHVEDSANDLIHLLKDKSMHVRWKAAYALGMLKEKNSVPYLIAVIYKNEYWLDLKWCAWALGEIGSIDAVDAIGELRKSEKAEMWEDASFAISKIGDPAYKKMLIWLKSKDPLLRKLAAKSIGYMKTFDAEQSLIDAINIENNCAAKGALITALAEIESRRAYEFMPDFVEQCGEYLSWGDDLTRGKKDWTRLFEAMVKIGYPEISYYYYYMIRLEYTKFYKPERIRNLINRQYISNLIKIALEEDKTLEGASLSMLLRNLGSIDSQPLLEYIKEPGKKKLASCIDALGELKCMDSIKHIFGYLTYGNESEKRSAIKALGLMKEKTAVIPIIEMLNDKEYQNEALEALGKIGDKRATLPIAGLLVPYQNLSINNLDKHRIRAILGSLILLKDVKALVFIYPYTMHLDLNVRWMAYYAYWQIGGKNSIEVLKNGLKDSDDSIRSSIYEYIFYILRRDSIPILLEGLNDTSQDVKYKVLYLLSLLNWKSQNESEKTK